MTLIISQLLFESSFTRGAPVVFTLLASVFLIPEIFPKKKLFLSFFDFVFFCKQQKMVVTKSKLTGSVQGTGFEGLAYVALYLIQHDANVGLLWGHPWAEEVNSIY